MTSLEGWLRSRRFRWLLGLVVLVVCSWARWGATGSIKIDENYPSARSGTILYLLLLGGWALVVSGWAGLLERPPEQPRRLIYAGLAITALMVPLLSNDLFGLWAWASMSAHGHDVYASAQALPASPWFPWIGERWREIHCPYGPLGLLAAAVPGVAGEHNPLLALLLTRLTWLVPLVAGIEVSLRVFRTRPFFHAMVWLNPVVLVEGAGQLHLDLLAMTAIVFGVLAQARGRGWGPLGWAVATFCKWNQVLAAPWFWLAGARSAERRTKRAAVMMLVLLWVGVIAFLPVWRGPDTIREDVRGLATETVVPGGSVVDVVGGIADAIRGHETFDPNVPVVERVARERAARASTWRVAHVVMLLFALAAALPLLPLLFRPRGRDDVAFGTGAFVVIVLTLASAKFQSWYFMGAAPFFGLSCPRAWRRWWPRVMFFAVAQEFPLVLPRDAALFQPAVAASVGASAFMFLWSFRARYYVKPDVAAGASPAGDYYEEALADAES